MEKDFVPNKGDLVKMYSGDDLKKVCRINMNERSFYCQDNEKHYFVEIQHLEKTAEEIDAEAKETERKEVDKAVVEESVASLNERNRMRSSDSSDGKSPFAKSKPFVKNQTQTETPEKSENFITISNRVQSYLFSLKNKSAFKDEVIENVIRKLGSYNEQNRKEVIGKSILELITHLDTIL